jgi:hypothetical protein
MGDLNDGPYNKALKLLGIKPLKRMYSRSGFIIPLGNGQKRFGHYSIRFLGHFDQIMVSQSLVQQNFSTFKYWKAGIYNKSF